MPEQSLHIKLDERIGALKDPRLKAKWRELRDRDNRADNLFDAAKKNLNRLDEELYNDVYTYIMNSLSDENGDLLADLYTVFRRYQFQRYTDMTQRLLHCVAQREYMYDLIDECKNFKD